MRLLERLGLHSPALRAWALYDWGNSAFFTLVVTAIFPIFFHDVAAAGLPEGAATARFALWSSVALIFVAVLSPIVGAWADAAAIRKRLLAACVLVGATATLAMMFIGEGEWRFALVVFAIGNVAVLLSLVIYDSLLPHIAKPSEIDRVSTAGYALGYLGGGLLLTLCLALILQPQRFGLPDAGFATRLSFALTALCWMIFSIPLLLRVPEPAAGRQGVSTREPGPGLSGSSGSSGPAVSGLRQAVPRLLRTFRELRNHRQAFLLLIAVLVYNDGITTIYRMATIFGREIGIDQSSLILAVVLVQFVGIPCSFLFGSLAARFGTKNTILFGLAVYLLITVLGSQIHTARGFFLMAIGVAMVQGGTQALGRSLYASMIPLHRSTEFFGFFAVAERFSAVLGPAVFGLTASFTGSSRAGVLAIVGFFIVGGALLLRVDVETGRQEGRAAS